MNRVWLVTQRSHAAFPPAKTPLGRAELSLLGQFRQAGRWYTSDIALMLFVRG